MAQNKTIQMPIVGGMRQDLSEHMAPPGTLVDAKNVRFTTEGEVESRRGTTALNVETGAEVTYDFAIANTGPDYLQRVPGGFVVGSQGVGYRYDFGKSRLHLAGGYSAAMPVKRFATMAVEEASYTLGNSTPWPLSVAVGGGYVAILWSGGQGFQSIDSAYGVRCQIFTEGGALVTTISTTAYLTGWVVYDSVNNYFILVGQETGSADPTKVDAAIITLASTGATLGSFTNVGTLNSTAGNWAVCSWPGDGWAMVHQSGATTATIQRMRGTTQQATTTFATGAADQPFSCYADTTHLYVGWVDVGADSVAKARVYSRSALTLTSGVGAVTIYTDTGQTSLTTTPPLFGSSIATSSAFLVVGRSLDLGSSSTAGTFMSAKTLAFDGTLTSVNQVAYNLFPVSGTFNSGMVWCRLQTPASSDDFGNGYVRYVLVDYVNNRFSPTSTYWQHRWPKLALAGDAFADPQPGDYRTAYRLHMCHPVQLSGGDWIAALPRLVRSEQPTGTTARGLLLGEWLRYSTAVPGRRVAAQFGAEVIVPGSPVLTGAGAFGTNHYATASLSEPSTANVANGMDLGFWCQPSMTAPSQSNTAAGGLTAEGVYQHRSVVEWVDVQGRRWRSRPSRARATTMTGANDTLTFTEVDDFAWVRQGFQSVAAVSNVVKHYYRTVDKGSTFYRVTPPQGAPIAGAGSTFVDTMSDLIAQTREVLYTDGGVLDNDHPSSCRYVAVTEDRVWLGGLWDPKQIQSSKTVIPGEPPQFSDSPAFKVVLPDDCTGLAVQDGMVIAFCDRSIYAIQGSGPNNQGQGAWESPRVITRSTGCISAQSIVETSAGIFFQSRRGIEILPRGAGEPVLIGQAVQDTLGSTSITSAAVVNSETSNTVRFCLGTTVVLAYDLDTGAWSRDVYPVAVTHICDTDSGAVLALKDVSNGYGFYLEEDNIATDSTGNSPVAVDSYLEFAALRPFGIAGQGRFLAAIGMFDELSTGSSPGYQAGNATISLSVDRDETNSLTLDAGKSWDMSVFKSPDYRRREPLQVVGSSAKLTLTTAVSGWRFMGFTVEVDEVGGGRRMGETEQG